MGKKATFVRSKDGFEYVMSDTDIEWLARSLWGESSTKEGMAAAAWCMMNRFLLWPGSKWSTFTSLIRSFSQPVNPKWRRDGEYCLPGGKGHGKADCKESRLKSRDKKQLTPYRDVPGVSKLYATLFAEGKLPNPLPQVPPYVDFASYAGMEKKGGINIAGNWFLNTEQTGMSWRGGVVEVRYDENNPDTPSTYEVPVDIVRTGTIIAWVGMTAWAIYELFK